MSDSYHQAFDLDPSAAAWMKAHNMSSSDVTDYFWKRVAKEVIPKVNKTLQVWYAPTFHTGDPPVTQMPKSTIADSWGGIDFAADACKAGYGRRMTRSNEGFLAPPSRARHSAPRGGPLSPSRRPPPAARRPPPAARRRA